MTAPPTAERHALPTLADVARSAGSEILSLVEMPDDDRQLVAGSVLYDLLSNPSFSAN